MRFNTLKDERMKRVIMHEVKLLTGYIAYIVGYAI